MIKFSENFTISNSSNLTYVSNLLELRIIGLA
jgi:hypothetical protein